MTPVRRGADIVDEDQESFVIETAAARWIYHKEGGGFSSLIDADGRDWLGYRPGGGPAGEYRGIPNMVFRGPEAGFFHPGHAGAKGSRSEVTEASAGGVTIVSTSRDDAWQVAWEIRADHARMRVLRVDARDPGYWLLYEGTPGGRFAPEASQCIRCTGETTSLTQAWEEALPSPAWVAFTDPQRRRSLVLRTEGRDCGADRGTDMYKPMAPMTVFGFGRRQQGVEALLRDAGRTLHVGLVEAATHAEVAAAITKWD